MESANSHHQLQDLLVGSSASSSSSLPAATINPSLYGFTTSHASWPPSSFLNSSNNWLSSYPTETKQQQQQQLYSMAPAELSWGININQNSEEEESRIKEELAEHYYRKYSEILSSSSSSSNRSPPNIEDNTSNHLQPQNVAATKFLLKSDFGSLDMNLEALDLLASSTFITSHNHIGFSNYAFDHPIPFYASNKVVSSNFVAAEAKRSSTKMEPKSLFQKPPKKSRLEARSSCPPFKVRKEKLGDRIAALQQLVAPFGKTDTASVLMEAIGYIKFLQSQVETLSVPYMKASRNKPNRVTKGI